MTQSKATTTLFLFCLPLVTLTSPTGETSPAGITGTNSGSMVQGGGKVFSSDCGNFGSVQRWYFPAPVYSPSSATVPASMARRKRQAIMGAGTGAAAASSSASSSAASMGAGYPYSYPYAAYAMPYGFPYYGYMG